jgi:hypothetical protein
MQHATAALAAFIVMLAVTLFLSFVLSWPVMMLWNGCLVGAIDGVQKVTWLQAWGLQFLFALLFKTTITKKG